MKNVDYDDFLRSIKEHQKMLPCPSEPQIGRFID
jgi:hypothetical protein